jgi:hypothetical protein
VLKHHSIELLRSNMIFELQLPSTKRESPSTFWSKGSFLKIAGATGRLLNFL